MKVLLTFTYDMSLEKWDKKGIISREISLYKELLEKNVEFIFLTFGTHKDLLYSNLNEKIKIIPAAQYIQSKIPKFHFIKSLLLPFKLKNIFLEADIIKTNQIRGSWIACVAKIFFKKKIIIRGGYERLNRHIFFSKKKGIKNYYKYLINYFWLFLTELIAYKLADGIILTNQDDIDFILKHFRLNGKYKKNKIRHLINFINTNLFKPLSITKKDKHILFIGNMHRGKNINNLVMAFKDLKDFSLDIIGKGYDEEKLREIKENQKININFLGLFPNNKIPEIINQYEIFILPSIYEGNPKVLLEAMSCGIACIGTNVHGINTILEHNENGYLCGTSVKAISEAILNLYNNEKLREQIGKNARKFILENCSLDTIKKKEYLFYKEILAQPRN